jgi:lysozyme
MNKRVKRRKKTGIKRWLKDKNKTTLIVAGILAMIIVIFLFCIFYVVIGTYKGLGASVTIPQSEYSQSGYYWKDGFLRYRDDTYTSAAGIDVSTFQGNINWKKVKKAGVDFVMIRVGYSGSANGSIQIDKRFKENIEGAKDAGIGVGVYFFSQAVTTDEAIKEAKFVIRHIRGRGVEYPVAFDMEHMDGDRISQLTDNERTKIADAFCTIVNNNGYTPMVYGNQKWLLHEIDMSYLTKYDTWLAHYSTTTAFPYAYKMWQYSNYGIVTGISGHVDLDIVYIKK